MLKSLLRIIVRLGATAVLVTCFDIPTRAGYFDQIYACNDNPYNLFDTTTYFGTLRDCRYNVFYPYEPTESQCRYNAGNSYLSCLNAIQEPMPELDFCDNANLVFQDCITQYGPNSGNEDLGAMMSCRNASGIDLCQ